MKRTALCLVAVALLLGIYVQNADAASITLLNMTQAYTGQPRTPTVVVSGATVYTITFQLCTTQYCAILTGPAFSSPPPIGPSTPGSSPSYYKVTVKTVNANPLPNVTKTGIFKINPPTGTLGGGTTGGGSEGGIVWYFTGLWSGDEAYTPDGSWYVPTSLSAELSPSWSLKSITVTTYDVDSVGAPTQHVDTLVPIPPAAPPVLSSGSGGGVHIWNDICYPDPNVPGCDAMGTGENGFVWDSIVGTDGFESTFGFTLDNPGIDIHYIPPNTDPNVPPPNVIMVSYDFTVGTETEPVSIERTWAIDYAHSDFEGAEKHVAFIETTPEPPLPPSEPTISFAGDITDGASYFFGSVPAQPTCTAAYPDGITTGLSCDVSGYSTAVGEYTLIATATDEAGNTFVKPETLSYTVLGWTLNGFYQPVDMNGIYNLAKGGSTIPLKFEIFAGVTELTDTAAVKSLKPTQTTCSATAQTDDIEVLSTASSTVVRYDTTAGQFIYNWKTPRVAGVCYRFTVTTQDGSSLQALFQLK
jgi:hypothetical protein